jgi:hypothetical protein
MNVANQKELGFATDSDQPSLTTYESSGMTRQHLSLTKSE